jgi:hypothetical protein
MVTEVGYRRIESIKGFFFFFLDPEIIEKRMFIYLNQKDTSCILGQFWKMTYHFSVSHVNKQVNGIG